MAKKKTGGRSSPAKTAATRPEIYDSKDVKPIARSRWADTLSRLCNIPSHLLDGKHHPCPKCGGTDRFRFTDQDGDGSAICNQCGKFGDGFAVLEWFTGRRFYDCVKLVAEHLGVPPSNGDANYKANGKHATNADPAEHLKFEPWNEGNELLAATWCHLWKKPITVAAIKFCHGRIARYRGKFTVIALPVWGEKLTATKPVGWTLYNISGGTLPSYRKNADGGWDVEQEKILTTYGSKPGLIGPVDQLAAATDAWKLEGPSDLLAFYSLADIPATTVAVTNSNGAGERPKDWIVNAVADKRAVVLHDADQPGITGAKTWAESFAFAAGECRIATLPYPATETHGKDLRDWVNERQSDDHARSFTELAAFAAAGEIIPRPSKKPTTAPIEAPDNYHRLARVNLERYSRHTADGNGTLRYWRNEWYKYDGTCYRKIDTDELKAKVGQAVREEFERIAAEEYAEWEASGDGDPPKVRNVGQALISNVLFATAQLCILSGTVELNTWIGGDGLNSTHRFVALRNGILDIDALLAGEPDHLKPHSPDWFSVTCLPFDFDVEADAPTFHKFLKRNLEGDEQRINLLMEWAGYLLLPNTDYQKFMFFEGEGANGKSVFLAAI